MSENNVKPLEWQLFWKQDEGHREYAITPFGTDYHVSNEGWWFPLSELNKCSGLEASKSAAQKDFSERAKACFEPETHTEG